MGGVVPLGYRVENRALHVVEEQAAFVRDLFCRYLEVGSVEKILDAVRERMESDPEARAQSGVYLSVNHTGEIEAHTLCVLPGEKGQDPANDEGDDEGVGPPGFDPASTRGSPSRPTARPLPNPTSPAPASPCAKACPLR